VNVISKTKKLGLPANEFVVVAGSAMAARGLRKTNDIDLVVSVPIFEKLKTEGWEEQFHDDGSSVLINGIYDVGTGWDNPDNKPNLESLLQDSDHINGVAVLRPERILRWKKRMNRPKDQMDIELLEAYLGGK
jgi:hypothetical protein